MEVHESQRTPSEQRRSRAESKEFTRQALLKAGLLELIEHGLDTPSLDAICARAGYTRGAFYVHFKDRDDFLVAVTDWALSSIARRAGRGRERETDLESAIGRFVALLTRNATGRSSASTRSPRTACSSRSRAPSS